MSPKQRFVNNRFLLYYLTRKSALQGAEASTGFTLIELLVVVVILGVLAAVGYQATISQIARANANTANNTATAIAKNCAGLLVTGDQGQFTGTIQNFYNPSTVTLTGNSTTCATGNQYTVQVGRTFCRWASASVNSNGSVSPSPDAFNNSGAPCV
jgi:prepilin-type N-terminal cleavage/methylation domain-containing protein